MPGSSSDFVTHPPENPNMCQIYAEDEGEIAPYPNVTVKGAESPIILLTMVLESGKSVGISVVLVMLRKSVRC